MDKLEAVFYKHSFYIGVMPIRQVKHVRTKNSNIQWRGHLMW